MREILTIIAVNSAVVALIVAIHYEFLFHLSHWLPKLKIGHRHLVVISVFGALVAHALEVWVFSLAYYYMHYAPNWGYLEGNFDGSLLDCAYFSFTTYTTLGFGDIQPIGDMRFLTGVESLTGLLLITWTASFLYLEMQRYWSASER